MECGEAGAPSQPAVPEACRPLQADGDLAEEQVMSEVHLGCPPHHSGPHISRFIISLPPRDEQIGDGSSSMGAKVCEVDEDGDLILTRRRNPRKDSFVVSIQHNITSSIPKVGLQVWRAELVLADFVLHMMYNSSNFDGIIAAELGAGTGLVGMLLARVANSVFVTDVGDKVLGNCMKNVHLNSGIFHRKASIYVRELDWNCSWPPEVEVDYPSKRSYYGWSAAEVVELQRASLLLAADVIYSDDLTAALFSLLEAIMHNSSEKVLYLALEKRYNFTIDDVDVVANGYSHFRSYIKDEEEEDDDPETKRSPSFIGRLIDLQQIPQYVQEYDRGNDVEVWQIRYLKRKP